MLFHLVVAVSLAQSIANPAVQSALAQVKPAPLELTAEQKAALKVITDGQGHYIFYDSKKPWGEPFFYGDGKVMVKTRVYGGGASGDESFDSYFWEPRIARGTGDSTSFFMKDSGKKFAVECGKRTTSFTPVAGDEAKKLVEAATFSPPTWTRIPERLLRDDKGTYYLVDRLRTEESHDRRDFRLFVGARGKMKQLPLKDIVDDSEGMIFSTKNGELRLIFAARGHGEDPGKTDFKWIEGKAKSELTDVPLDISTNSRLVYVDLGPYAGQRLGTPCDDLM